MNLSGKYCSDVVGAECFENVSTRFNGTQTILKNGNRTRNHLNLASRGGEETNNVLIMLEGETEARSQVYAFGTR